MKRFIYAYHLIYQTPEGKTAHCDGVADMDNEIRTIEQYRDLKKKIEPDNHETATICSLTLIAN